MSYKDILNRKAREWSCLDMLSSVKDEIQKIPFSSPLVNWLLYGGIPRGRIVEFFGEESGGKSSSSQDLCFNAIKMFKKEHEEKVQLYREYVAKGKKEYQGPLEDLLDQGPKAVVYWDLEHSFDWKWAAKLGLKRGDMDLVQPGNVGGEDICQAVEEIARSGEVGLIVMDSIPSLVTKAEWEKKYGERTVSSLAGLMTTFMRKMEYVCAQNDCTLILINQTRDNMDNPYVIQTPGGRAIKFYATTRLYFRKGAPLDFAGNELTQNAENPAGYKITVKLVKQKGAPFDRKIASYYLMAQSGIRPDFDYAKLAVDKYNIILKRGAWFSICDPTTGEVLEDSTGKPIKLNGMLKVYDYLKEHRDYYETLKTFINNDINGVEANMEDVLPENFEYVYANEDKQDEANTNPASL